MIEEYTLGIIYCYTNEITCKKYIGQTIHPEQRKRNHKHSAIKGSDYYFHRSLRKRGIENFTYEVLEENIEHNNLNNRENHYIDKFNTIWPNGYNQQHANSISQFAINKMSDTKKKQWQLLSENERKQNVKNRNLTNLGNKQSDYQKQRVKETRQKKYEITFPDGHKEIIINLSDFCRKYPELKYGDSNFATYGKHKGYKAIKLD